MTGRDPEEQLDGEPASPVDLWRAVHDEQIRRLETKPAQLVEATSRAVSAAEFIVNPDRAVGVAA